VARTIFTLLQYTFPYSKERPECALGCLAATPQILLAGPRMKVVKGAETCRPQRVVDLHTARIIPTHNQKALTWQQITKSVVLDLDFPPIPTSNFPRHCLAKKRTLWRRYSPDFRLKQIRHGLRAGPFSLLVLSTGSDWCKLQ
jgi:hypothetical protein